jgi:hypothetical protein
MNKAEREAELRQLWQQRPVEQRTAVDVLAFYTWVQQNRAYLFYGTSGDPYQTLKSVLRGQIVGEP